ncbi:MAG: preprotein translocase subunit SecG [Hydrotalea sp.]|nr:preprotein translocase subunit SecG [Hydrotalea sp.]MDI9314470.1 preprotein translocase subunit SecG [Hydrotalea sp.]
MITFLLIIHAIIALVLIVFVLLQKSEGGSLGFGGGGNSMFSVRGTANFLTRTTAILATAFMITSLILAILFTRGSQNNRSILKDLDNTAPAAPAATTPGTDKKSVPALPGAPPAADDLKPFDTAPSAPKAQ